MWSCSRSSRQATALVALAAAALVLGACSAAAPRPRPVVALLSDFGTRDDAAALLRGAVLAVAPEAEVADITHEVEAFDVDSGALLLEDAPAIFPPGTVFCAVVDPGVGTARRAIAVELENGRFLVGPDNGLLSGAIERHGAREVRAIENRAFFRAGAPPSTTFHGRDIFAPAAAHIARGDPPFGTIGPRIEDWKRLSWPAPLLREGRRGNERALEAVVRWLDGEYGNIWTNVAPNDLEKLAGGPAPPRALVFELEGTGGRRARVEAPLVRTFGDVPEGAPLAYWNSRGRLSFALNKGNAAARYGVARGARVRISIPGEAGQ